MGMALNLAKKRKKLKGNFLRLDEIALRLGQLCLNCYEVSLCQVSMAIANFEKVSGSFARRYRFDSARPHQKAFGLSVFSGAFKSVFSASGV